MTGVNGPVEDLTGRRLVVVTGASSGIGLAAAVGLACRGDQVALVGRDPARLQAAAERVRENSGERPELFRADFAILDDVRRLAEQLRATYDRIDVLANNAGAIALQPLTTVDGFEMSIQANHLAPFLLTNLLADRVGRVVVTASGAHRFGTLDPDDLNAPLRGYRSTSAYGTSKQANILFTVEAARRWPRMSVYSFHPGVVRTRFGNDSRLVAIGMRFMPFRSPEKGAETLVWLANQDRSRLVDGGYYVDRRLRRPYRKATNRHLAARLWEASAKAVGIDD
ncbi:short-subunit dehydrogenase [Micromonospora taraxaci]|uniref:Short-subunit dehydrogenase n=1 Tax=Micromonospora taraxaci TaxID=1316803 RepID=A0A561VE97_9ACTN|nr:short-subunit dehydrogenase [Micromonospora taraxaci]